MFIAAMFSENIEKMVAHAANAYFEDEDIEMIHQVKDVSNWSARMRAPMEATYGVDYFPQLWNEWVEGILKISNATPDKDICRERLAEIRCPSLIIHGSKDAMVSNQHPEILHKRINGSKYAFKKFEFQFYCKNTLPHPVVIFLRSISYCCVYRNKQISK